MFCSLEFKLRRYNSTQGKADCTLDGYFRYVTARHPMGIFLMVFSLLAWNWLVLKHITRRNSEKQLVIEILFGWFVATLKGVIKNCT